MKGIRNQESGNCLGAEGRTLRRWYLIPVSCFLVAYFPPPNLFPTSGQFTVFHQAER